MHCQRPSSRQSGSTLIYIIIALVVFGALTAASVSMYSSSQMSSARPNCAAQARLLAESGLRYAASELRPFTDLAAVNARIAELTGSQRINTLSDGSSFTYTAITAPYQVGGTGAYFVNVTCRGDSCPGSEQSQVSLTATYALSVASGGQLGFEDDLENFNVVGEGATSGDAGEAGNSAVTVNLDDRTVELGGNAREVFGCIWYGGDMQTCTDGNCTLGSGFRAYFEFELEPGSQADGFTFAVISAESNSPSACGGSVGTNLGELLGYAGPGVSGKGIQPPKLALEFDIYQNGGSGRPCSSNSRKDGSVRDHVAAIYWGREAPNSGCDGSYDDNRHGEGELTDEEPRNPGDWSDSGSGFDGYFYMTNNWIREWNNSTPNRHKRFRVRVELDRALEPNESGFYCYNLKGWIKRDNETLPEGFTDLTTDFADPADAATLPDVTDSLVLNAARHADMEHVMFGWTTATGGATMNATLAEFELDFKPAPEPCAVREAPQDYVSYWSMYEGSGDVLHDLNATNNNDGAISDSVWVAGVGCPSCSGLLVDNRNEGQAHIPSDWSLTLGNAGTVSAWIYLNSYQDWGGIVHHGDSSNQMAAHGDSVFVDETYTLQFTSNNARIDGGRINRGERKPMICTIADGPGWQATLNCAVADNELELQRWYHVVGTWDTTAPGNEMLLYINGQLDGSRNSCAGARNYRVGLHIGSQINSGGYPIDGVIDEVYVYDRMLSAAEVQALYNDGLEQP